MKRMPTDVSMSLIPFGFTSLESEIYTLLLQESPATGYRVAQALGKAAANVYKAIESLQQKGAILVEEGASRSCRAVPADELLARLTRDFEWRRAEAELSLARLERQGSDERVYALRSRAQVIERARHMIGSAEVIVLLSCSGHVVHQLGDSLAACARRKAQVMVSCPEALNIAGISAVIDNPPLDEIRLVVDASEHLLGLFAKGREDLVQAIWSSAPYLSVCVHRGLTAEMAARGLPFMPAEQTPGFAKIGWR